MKTTHMSETNHSQKSGFVTIIGRSNVGKSTLLNTLIGTKIAITTPKPQTTRKPVQGVLNDERGQVVFVDTPGIMQKARDQLTKTLTDFVRQSLHDIDAVIYVADPTREIGNEEKQALRMLEGVEVPKLLALNKNDERAFNKYRRFYEDLAGGFDKVLDISAMTGSNLNLLKDWIFEHVPEGEAYYPFEQFSNLSHEERLAELVREKLFLRLKQEVPYSTHVEVVDLADSDVRLAFQANIYTYADRYKGMIIGKGGEGLKEIRRSVVRELQTITGKQIHMKLHVEVDPRWVDRLEY